MFVIGKLEIWWNGYAWDRPRIHRFACGQTMLDFGKVGLTWLSCDCTKGDDK